MNYERLETPKQLAERVGISERRIRHLIQTRQLEYIMIGCRVHIPIGAFPRYMTANMVAPSWHDETKDRDSAGSKNETPTTFSGPKTAAAASAQLLRQTARKLRSCSRNGSAQDGAEPARVIPLRSS